MNNKTIEQAAYDYSRKADEVLARVDIINAFLAGAKWQKEQMLKDAIDGDVVKIFPEGAASIHYQAPCGIGTMAYFCKAETLNDGDKVKVIIVKKEDEK